MPFMDRFRGRQSYADRLRSNPVRPGMVAPTKTPYGSQLDELSEFLNPSSKVMRTSQAADIYEPIKVLGDPRTSSAIPEGPLKPATRAPRFTANAAPRKRSISNAISTIGMEDSPYTRPSAVVASTGTNPPSAVGNIRTTTNAVGDIRTTTSGVGNIRTTSGQGIIGDIGPSRKVRPTRAVGGLEGRGVRPTAGSRRRPIRWWT